MIAELVGAADLARELKEPASMISAFRNIAQMSGYYRWEGVRPENRTDKQCVEHANFAAMNDSQLLAMIANDGGGAPTH